MEGERGGPRVGVAPCLTLTWMAWGIFRPFQSLHLQRAATCGCESTSDWVSHSEREPERSRPHRTVRCHEAGGRSSNAAVRASITGRACHNCCGSSSQHCPHFHSYRLVKFLLRPPVRGPCSEAPILISKGLHADQPLMSRILRMR